MPTADRRIVEGPAGARARLARNLVGALVGGLLIASVEFAATRTTVEYSIVGQLAWLARLALHWSLAALPLGIAFDGLERRAAPGTPSTLGYAIATLAGACVGAGVMAVHGKYVDPAISATALGFDLPLPDRFLYGFWQLGFWGAVGAVLHSTDLRRRLGLTYLFIAHNLGVVRHVSDRIAVMYLGRIVELATRDTLFAAPLHPYTEALLSAVPVPDPEVEAHRQRIPLPGEIPSPTARIEGCPFRSRCPKAFDRCATEAPALREHRPDQWAACHLPETASATPRRTP